MIECTDTGLVYRNPKPHLYARHTWHPSLVRLPTGELLAAFDIAVPDDRPERSDRETGGAGGRAGVVPVPAGRQAGAVGELSRLDGDEWVNLEETPVWHGAGSGMTGEGISSDELSGLKFGYPSPIRRPDGEVMAVFWCEEDAVNTVRWVRLRIS